MAFATPAAPPCETTNEGITPPKAPIAIPAIAPLHNPPDEFVLGAAAALVSATSVSVAEALFEEVLVLARLSSRCSHGCGLRLYHDLEFLILFVAPCEAMVHSISAPLPRIAFTFLNIHPCCVPGL